MSLNGRELYEFQGFQLDVGERLLERKGKRVELTDRAFDVLSVLVRNSGRLVTKDQLLEEVWSGTFVEENSINKNISLLRKALGADAKFIETVRGRGYRFVAKVNKEENSESSNQEPATVGKFPPAPRAQRSPAQEVGNVVALVDWRQMSDIQPDQPHVEEVAAPKEQEAASNSSTETTVESASARGSAAPVNPRPDAKGFLKRHIFTLVLAGVVLLGGVILLGYSSFYSSPPPITSVAVLPFENGNSDPELDYLTEGLSESLIDELSQLPQLKVISRNSSFKYKGTDTTFTEIAAALGVRALVTGRVSRRGDELTIRTELIEAGENRQLWGGQYARNVSELPLVRKEIARVVAEKLRLDLTGRQQQQFSSSAVVDPKTFELLLKARFYRSKPGPENALKATEYCEQAVAASPTYALAFAELADVYLMLANNSIVEPRDAIRKAGNAALRAVELDDTLPDGHVVLAQYYVDDWNWQLAEREFKRALELNPNSARAHNNYASFLSIIERHDEAIEEAKRSRELNPLSERETASVANKLVLAKRCDEALNEYSRIPEISPDMAPIYLGIANAYACKGDFRAALVESEKAPADIPYASVQLGVLSALSGSTAMAREILKKLESGTQYVSPAELASLYAVLGEKEKAFALLEKAYAARDLQLKYLRIDYGIDSLRTDPRYAALLARMNF